MKSAVKFLFAVPAFALLSGCLTWTPRPQDAANAVALVAPQYAGQASAVASVVGTKAKSKSAKSGSVSLDGFTPARIYRVRGVITEAKDISWTDIWSREGNAATDDISAPPIVEVQTNAIPLTNDAATVSTDEAFAKQGAEDIAAIKAAKGRK